MTQAIRTERLTKVYGRHRALSGANLEVGRGEVYGLIGPNGAGKTTLMRILLDIIRPTSGSVTVLGTEPRTGGAAQRRRLGYLPGELALDGNSTGRALLTHYARLSGGAHRIDELAERLGFDPDRRLGSLSKGNRQKVGLIQAFMHDPELLVLDEPSSGLDPLVQQQLLELIREARAAGRTVFLSSHVLSEIEHVAERVAILREGRIVRTAAVAELRAAALRRVRVTVPTADGASLHEALEQLPGVAGLSRRVEAGRAVVSCRLEGSPGPLLRELASRDVLDFAIAEPDLEEAVLDIYRIGART